MDQVGMCACQRVKYDPILLDGTKGGRMRERWRCEDCKMVFVKQPVAPELPAEPPRILGMHDFRGDGLCDYPDNAGRNCGLTQESPIHYPPALPDVAEGEGISLRRGGPNICPIGSIKPFRDTRRLFGMQNKQRGLLGTPQ